MDGGHDVKLEREVARYRVGVADRSGEEASAAEVAKRLRFAGKVQADIMTVWQLHGDLVNDAMEM